MCKNNKQNIKNIKSNFVDLEQRYLELLRVHNQLMGQDNICPDCMYGQLLDNTSQSIDLLDDLKSEIDNDQLSSDSDSEIIADCKIMDEITNSKHKKKKKIIISFE
jgi:hypothetical protein